MAKGYVEIKGGVVYRPDGTKGWSEELSVTKMTPVLSRPEKLKVAVKKIAGILVRGGK